MLARKLSAPTAAGGSWTPTDLGSNLIAWYDASDSGSITGSSPVTAWNDISGTGNHLVSSGGGPTYSATGFNSGYPGMIFSASSTTRMVDATFTGTSGAVLSTFMVGTMTGSTEAFGRAVSYTISGGNDYDSTTAAALILRDNANNNVQSYRNSAGRSTKAISLSTPTIIGCVYDGTNHTMYVDNVAASPSAFTSNFSATNAYLYIGADGAVTSWDGYICEIIMFTTAPDSTLLNNIDSYFTTKWGL